MYRTRTHTPAVIGYGLYLYFNSRSFRLAAKSLTPIKKRSHVSIYLEMGPEVFGLCRDRFRTDKNVL